MFSKVYPLLNFWCFIYIGSYKNFQLASIQDVYLRVNNSYRDKFYLWCTFKLMGILIPKYSNKKFGGGVKVFPMIIRGAGHSV